MLSERYPQPGAPRVGGGGLGDPLGQHWTHESLGSAGTGSPIAGPAMRDVFGSVDPVPVS